MASMSSNTLLPETAHSTNPAANSSNRTRSYSAMSNTADGKGSVVDDDDDNDKRIRLPRVFSVWNTSAYIICVIMGSGIFVSPKGVLQLTGSPGMALVMWLVTGLVNALVALCYAELVLTFPRAGSDYTYLREGLGQFPAFLYIWVHAVFMEGSGWAIASLTFSTYFCQTFYGVGCSPPESLKKIVAALAFSLLTAIHCYSSRFAVKFSNVFTVAKLLGILVIIASGIAYVSAGHTENLTDLLDNSSSEPGSYALAFYTANWAFGGTQSSMNIIEEVKEPVRRNIVLSIFISQATIITVYLLANVAYVAVLSPAEILASDAVAMTLCEKVFSGLFWVMPFFVSCSTFGGMNNSIMNGSRMILAASREHHLPRPLRLLNAKYLTPIPILAVSMTLALVLLSTNGIYSLILYTSYIYVLSMFLSIFVLVKMRFTSKERTRPFKLPLVVPVFALLVLVLLLILPIYEDPLSTGLCFAFVASGVPVYFFIGMERKPRLLLRLEWRVVRTVQKLCYALPEDEVDCND